MYEYIYTYLSNKALDCYPVRVVTSGLNCPTKQSLLVGWGSGGCCRRREINMVGEKWPSCLSASFLAIDSNYTSLPSTSDRCPVNCTSVLLSSRPPPPSRAPWRGDGHFSNYQPCHSLSQKVNLYLHIPLKCPTTPNPVCTLTSLGLEVNVLCSLKTPWWKLLNKSIYAANSLPLSWPRSEMNRSFIFRSP